MIQLSLLNGRSMPALGLGTWDLHGSTCVSAVQRALKLGYRHIDTAEMYGNEEEIAKGKNRRLRLYAPGPGKFFKPPGTEGS